MIYYIRCKNSLGGGVINSGTPFRLRGAASTRWFRDSGSPESTGVPALVMARQFLPAGLVVNLNLLAVVRAGLRERSSTVKD